MYDESLVTDNLNLARYVARKYFNTGLEYEDLQQIAFLGLVKAATSFDESKGYAFSTFAAHCMENEIKSVIRKKRICAESLYEPVQDNLVLADTIEDEANTLEKFTTEETLKYALNELNEQERFIVDSLYVKDPRLKQCELAKNLGLSQAQVCRIAKRALKKIKSILTGEPYAP